MSKRKKVSPAKALVVKPVKAAWTDIGSVIRKALSSRKFWATLSAVMLAATQGDWMTVAHLVMVYVGVQGTVDAVKEFKAK